MHVPLNMSKHERTIFPFQGSFLDCYHPLQGYVQHPKSSAFPGFWTVLICYWKGKHQLELNLNLSWTLCNAAQITKFPTVEGVQENNSRGTPWINSYFPVSDFNSIWYHDIQTETESVVHLNMWWPISESTKLLEWHEYSFRGMYAQEQYWGYEPSTMCRIWCFTAVKTI